MYACLGYCAVINNHTIIFDYLIVIILSIETITYTMHMGLGTSPDCFRYSVTVSETTHKETSGGEKGVHDVCSNTTNTASIAKKRDNHHRGIII